MNNQWQLKYEATGTSTYERYGSNVCLSANGQVAVIATTTNKVDTYKIVNSAWNKVNTMTIANTSSNGLYSLALSTDGSILAVGSPKSNTYGSGSVQVYTYSENGWSLRGDVIVGTELNEEFGSSVGMSGDGTILVVGAPNWGINDLGRVSVFQWNGSSWNTYGQVATETYGRFGASVAITADGSKIYVGETGYSSGGILSRGAVYTFLKDVSYGDIWKGSGILLIGMIANQEFGKVLALSGNGNVLAVGSPSYDSGKGRINIYDTVNGNRMPITGLVNGEGLGNSIGLSYDGFTMIYGSVNGTYTRVVTWSGTQWGSKGTVPTVTSVTSNQRDGYSVSISADGNTIVSSAPQTSTARLEDGKVRIFTYEAALPNRPKYKVTNRQEIEDAIADPTIQSIEVLNDINTLTILSSSSDTKVFYTLAQKVTLSS
jgi:hypothetical protein